MSEISLKDIVVPSFAPIFTSNLPSPCRYVVAWGGRNTGKSHNIGGINAIFDILRDPNCNIMFVRKNDTDNRQSTFANILKIIDSMGLTKYFRSRTSPYEIERKATGQTIVFRGLNNPTGLTGIKPKKGEFTRIIFEEASELDSYEDLIKVDGSIRAPDGVDLKIIFLLNGWDQDCMIYDTFVKGHAEADMDYLETHPYWAVYDPDFSIGFGKGLVLHQSTFRANTYRASYYDENAAIVKVKEPERYKVEFLGMWGHTTDVVYPCFTEGNIVDGQWAASQDYAYYAIGIDFGGSNGEGNRAGKDKALESATTMQLVGITRGMGKIVCIDEWFWSNELQGTKKTGPQMQKEMIATIRRWQSKYASNYTLMKGRIPIYVDSADSGGYRSGLLDESNRQGLRNTFFEPSTKHKIMSRIDFANHMMAYQDFLVSRDCPNLIREIRQAKRGENGKPREDINDHALNANEYAWAPFMRQMARWSELKEH